MPYKIEKRGEEFCVINKDSGKVKGCHDTMMKATRQMRLMMGIESGEWKPTGAKAKS